MELHHGECLHLALRVGLFDFRVGERDHCERETVQTGGRFDDVRDVVAFEKALAPSHDVGFRFRAGGRGVLLFFAFDQCGALVVAPFRECLTHFVVEDLLRFPGVFLVLRKVEISARCDAFELFGSKREFAEDVHASAGVVREFLGFLPVVIEHIRAEADARVVRGPLRNPVAVPHFPAPVWLRCGKVRAFAPFRHGAADGFDGFIGLDEKLQFHLLELAGAEGEIARRDFVAERLSDLADAERDSLA